VIVVAGTHGPSDPTLDKQQRLDGLRREYQDDLRRYRTVTKVLRWLDNPTKESAIMRGRSESLEVPDEYEGHYRLFLAMVESATNDILRAPPGSERFESALEWLTVGWGYEVMREITRGAGRIRDYWRQVADDRRGGLTRVVEA
jgi:hypothetical protein